MIGRLRGVLLEKKPPQLLIDVAGVGYEVNAPMSTFYQLPETGSDVVLHTHLVVREDNQSLYGFASLRERQLFRSLIKISGIGARMALTILSGSSPEEFAQHVVNQDTKALTRLPGIGKKTAERLIIEMRDKLDSHTTGQNHDLTNSVTGLPMQDPIQEAVSALIALGYKAPDASLMIQNIEDKMAMRSEELIRKALQSAGTPIQ